MFSQRLGRDMAQVGFLDLEPLWLFPPFFDIADRKSGQWRWMNRRLDGYKNFCLGIVAPSCMMAPSSSNPLLLLLLSSPILLLVLILQAGSGQASRGEEALVEFPQVHKKNLIQSICLIQWPISVWRARSFLPGKTKSHKTYWSVSEKYWIQKSSR